MWKARLPKRLVAPDIGITARRRAAVKKNEEREMGEKIAVVTGGSLGLGRETARLLLDQGYRVAIFGRGQASLDDAVADLGRGVLAVSVDVSDDTSVVAGFAKEDEALGPVDVLINSAAVFRPFLIEKASAS